jgi:elongation factor P
MTISSSEIRRNMTILMDGDVYQIMEWQHRQAPKAPPTLTLKVRQLSTGSVFERKLNGNHKLTVAQTERRNAQYLYKEGDFYVFMDMETYEQQLLGDNLLGDATYFLPEGGVLVLLMYEEKPILVELPSAVNLSIAHTDVGLKGDTQSGATKPATTETGLTLQVPLFVNEGDRISVNTTTKGYIGRAD